MLYPLQTEIVFMSMLVDIHEYRVTSCQGNPGNSVKVGLISVVREFDLNILGCQEIIAWSHGPGEYYSYSFFYVILNPKGHMRLCKLCSTTPYY